MDNIQIVEIESMGITTQHVIIDRGNGEFTSMPKAHWDELQSQKELGGTL